MNTHTSNTHTSTTHTSTTHTSNNRPGRPFVAAFGRRALLAGLAVAAPLALAACGDDADAAGIEDGVLTVDLVDFSFGELPDSVPAGTRLEVTNASTAELHELVAIKLPADERRSAADLVESGLPDLLAGGPPAAVLLAAPGGEQIPAVGDGTLSEPGRYLILCSIPTGVEPGEYLAAAAASNGEPPQVEGGAPHFAHGMFDDLVVE